MITLENKKVHDFIVAKDTLVAEGRKISQKIEDTEKQIAAFEEKERKITAKVIPPKELTDRGDTVVKEMMKHEDELNKIGKQINDFKLEAVPKEMKESHIKLLKEKEVLERDRNKIALKVQKLKDRIVPVVQKAIKPLLKDEFDDVSTAKAKDGKVIIETFSWLEDWKKQFRNRK